MRYLVPLLFGVIGCAVLLSLGVWQIKRMTWKKAILTDIVTRIEAAPVGLPAVPDPIADRYLPVQVSGRTSGEELHVLASMRDVGAIYRVIVPFETDAGRWVLVDLGAIPTTAKDAPRPATAMSVTGNLHWPDEIDSFTPDKDMAKNIWFARDVSAMSRALGTDPVLIVARSLDPAIEGVTPLPISVAGIPNDHLQYAITWFSLAAIWLGMTGYFLSRMRRTKREG